MRKQLIISNKEQIEGYRTKIVDVTNNKMHNLLKDYDGIELLRKIKFTQFGFDPLFDEQMNFIEMTNQTFTYLVCLKAVEILLSIHPTKGFLVNFGTESGYDVLSEDESIICECFAATTPDSNDKLQKDAKKVSENIDAEHKYVIFYVSNQKPIHLNNIRKKYQEIKIIALDTI